MLGISDPVPFAGIKTTLHPPMEAGQGFQGTLVSGNHLGLERTPAIVRLIVLALALLRTLLPKLWVVFFAKQYAVVCAPFRVIDKYLVGLIDNAGVPVFTSKVRMLFEFLHQRAVACTDDLYGRIGLYKQNAVVIALVFHGDPEYDSPTISRHPGDVT